MANCADGLKEGYYALECMGLIRNLKRLVDKMAEVGDAPDDHRDPQNMFNLFLDELKRGLVSEVDIKVYVTCEGGVVNGVGSNVGCLAYVVLDRDVLETGDGDDLANYKTEDEDDWVQVSHDPELKEVEAFNQEVEERIVELKKFYRKDRPK